MVVQYDKWKNSSSTIVNTVEFTTLLPLEILNLQLSKILGNYSEGIFSVMAKVEMTSYIHLQT